MKALIALVLLLGLAMPAAADPVRFRDEARNISFAYNGDVWKPVTVEGSEAQIRIEWRLLGGEYLADCYLRAGPSAFAAAIEGSVHQGRSKVAEVLTRFPQELDPDAQLLINENIFIGTQQVIHLRQRFIYARSEDHVARVVLDTLYTARDGEDIMFECKHVERHTQGADLIAHVEQQMRLVSDSLSFGN